MARPERKKSTLKSDDDTATGVEKMTLKDPRDERSDPEEEEDDDDDDMTGEDETIPMRTGTKRVPQKITPACSTREEDRVICITWYETFLNLRPDAAEYIYDLQELTKPANWAKLNEKTINMIVKGSREREIHVNATAANKMVLLAFLCMHQERIQRPLRELTSVDEENDRSN
jgi:hypothetical protein